MPAKLDVAFLPVRIPLVDWSRQLEKEDDSTRQDLIQADVLSDLMHCWLAQKYGEDIWGKGWRVMLTWVDLTTRLTPFAVVALKTKKHAQHQHQCFSDVLVHGTLFGRSIAWSCQKAT